MRIFRAANQNVNGSVQEAIRPRQKKSMSVNQSNMDNDTRETMKQSEREQFTEHRGEMNKNSKGRWGLVKWAEWQCIEGMSLL